MLPLFIHEMYESWKLVGSCTTHYFQVLNTNKMLFYNTLQLIYILNTITCKCSLKRIEMLSMRY